MTDFRYDNHHKLFSMTNSVHETRPAGHHGLCILQKIVSQRFWIQIPWLTAGASQRILAIQRKEILSWKEKLTSIACLLCLNFPYILRRVVTFRVEKVVAFCIFILCIKKLLQFGLLFYFAAKVVTFCVSYYILRLVTRANPSEWAQWRRNGLHVAYSSRSRQTPCITWQHEITSLMLNNWYVWRGRYVQCCVFETQCSSIHYTFTRKFILRYIHQI